MWRKSGGLMRFFTPLRSAQNDNNQTGIIVLNNLYSVETNIKDLY